MCVLSLSVAEVIVFFVVAIVCIAMHFDEHCDVFNAMLFALFMVCRW